MFFKRSKKLIIFDLDGTISNLWNLEREKIFLILEKENKNILKKDIFLKLDSMNQKTSSLFEIYKHVGGKIYDKEMFKVKYINIQKKIDLNINIFLNCDFDLIKKIKKNFDFAIATGSHKTEALFVLKKFKILRLFLERFFITSDFIKDGKETGKPFLYIKNNTNYKSYLVIGDSSSDKIGAEKNNMEFLKVEENNLDSVLEKLL